MKLIFIIFLTALSLFASLSKEQLDDILVTEGSLAGEGEVEDTNNDVNKVGTKTSSRKFNEDTYEDVASYNLYVQDVQNRSGIRVDFANQQKGLLADNVLVQKKIKAEIQAKLDAMKKKEVLVKDMVVSITGYCSIRNTVSVEQIQGYGMLECNFDENEFGIDASDIFVSFVPIPNKLALIAKGIYLQVGKKKIAISDGVVLTADRTSLNVATFVNDRKISKITGDLLVASSQLALDSSMLYMRQKELSKIKEKIVVNSSISGSQVSQTRNIEAPNAKNYLVNFGVQLASALVDIGGRLIGNNNYPLFKVGRGSQFYVDFSVQYSGKNKKAIDYLRKEYKNIVEKRVKGIKFNLKTPNTFGTNSRNTFGTNSRNTFGTNSNNTNRSK